LTDERRGALRASLDQWSAHGFRLLGIASRADPSDQATAVLTDEKNLTFAEGVFHARAQKFILLFAHFLLLAPYGGSS
jgi:hypothetical protein